MLDGMIHENMIAAIAATIGRACTTRAIAVNTILGMA
jgi:hypothetical protein